MRIRNGHKGGKLEISSDAKIVCIVTEIEMKSPATKQNSWIIITKLSKMIVVY